MKSMDVVHSSTLTYLDMETVADCFLPPKLQSPTSRLTLKLLHL